MPRPWTGRAPLPSSKKKLREFDSFRLPPPHKKGVKPVQALGPYLPGSVPGRDGLTHNMLDNIHAHWKRRRVCKIKCKGVCTVDMENVRQQLEERTGGKIIRSQGGVIFLFRGRNYNYRTPPRFPLMLWRPVTPVYPRLVQQVPEGLTLEGATEMRNKGTNLIPICKLGKNGMYTDLVRNVREAFEECELVRINCEGMNGSDYRRIGAKLKDLVPCALISFAYEHILVWRGRNWKSSLPKLENGLEDAKESDIEGAASLAPSLEGQEITTSYVPTASENDASSGPLNATRTLYKDSELMCTEGSEESSSTELVDSCSSTEEVSDEEMASETKDISDMQSPRDDELGTTRNTCDTKLISDSSGCSDVEPAAKIDTSGIVARIDDTNQQVQMLLVQRVLSLLQQSVEGGSAVVLHKCLDADIVYQKTVAFSLSALPGPVFRLRPRKVAFKKTTVSIKKGNDKKSAKTRMRKDFDGRLDNIVPQGSLGVDELAKLLA
ncbi:hypothetical protein UlMin_022198 [Ulmus minor]